MSNEVTLKPEHLVFESHKVGDRCYVKAIHVITKVSVEVGHDTFEEAKKLALENLKTNVNLYVNNVIANSEKILNRGL